VLISLPKGIVFGFISFQITPANPQNLCSNLNISQFSTQVETIQNTLGISEQSTSSLASKSTITSSKKAGIDVVLGSQWGDEGKGKLVDMLSQVSVKYFKNVWIFFYIDLFLLTHIPYIPETYLNLKILILYRSMTYVPV